MDHDNLIDEDALHGTTPADDADTHTLTDHDLQRIQTHARGILLRHDRGGDDHKDATEILRILNNRLGLLADTQLTARANMALLAGDLLNEEHNDRIRDQIHPDVDPADFGGAAGESE